MLFCNHYEYYLPILSSDAMNHASSVGGDVESSSIISEREDVQARRDGDASRSNSSSSEKEQKESLRKKRRDSKVTVDLRIGSLSHQVSDVVNLIMHQLCVTIECNEKCCKQIDLVNTEILTKTQQI